MSRLERHWQRVTPVSAALYPVSLVFRAVAAMRRAAYARRLIPAVELPVPVIVVGNITVGGTGKTPLVLWLAAFLSRHGRRPGIISRGYGGAARGTTPVNAESDPARVGDEAVLLAQRSGCPVQVGQDRPAAALALLAAHPECDVLLSDDGLQHYRLARDVEIAVIDGSRGLGNGLMLPAGPLREPAARLDEVDAVVVNGVMPSGNVIAHALGMRVEGRTFSNLLNPGHTVGAEQLRRQRVHAVAGIGNPSRFFAHLNALGIQFAAHRFPDHHAYRASDLAFADCDAVVMTEKDAVKCVRFATEKQWALRVDAEPDPALGELVLSRLRKTPSR